MKDKKGIVENYSDLQKAIIKGIDLIFKRLQDNRINNLLLTIDGLETQVSNKYKEIMEIEAKHDREVKAIESEVYMEKILELANGGENYS